MPRRRRKLTRSTLLVLGGAVAVVTFAVGFLLSYDDSALHVATGPTTTASTAPSVSKQTTTSTTAAVTTTVEVPTTFAATAPSSVLPTITTTPPSTQPPTTAPPPPAHFTVTYPHDPSGEMQLLEGSVSAVIIFNDGGSPSTYLVQGVGFITVGANGTSAGTLEPGAVVRVPLRAGTNLPAGTPPPQGSVTVLDSHGPVITIPVVITPRPRSG